MLNRQQRRESAKTEKARRKAMWPSGDVGVPAATGLKDGDIFTIKGTRRLENGHFDFNCAEGMETKFVAKRLVKKDNFLEVYNLLATRYDRTR
jgi:hypothetical protein